MAVHQITVRQQTAEMVLDALYLYSNALSSVVNQSEKIAKEAREVEVTISLVQRALDEDDVWSRDVIALDEPLWKLLRGVCLQYVDAKRSKLAIAKQAENIIGSTEADEEKLDQLNEFLHAPDVERVGERKPLVKNFIRLLPSEGEEADKLSVQVQAGDIYGQLIIAGNNSGSQTQNNYHTVYAELNKITELLTDESTDIPQEIRANALGDVQTIQSQLTKENPDKNILKSALKGLSILADTAQLGQAAVAIAPHLDKLVHAVKSIL